MANRKAGGDLQFVELASAFPLLTRQTQSAVRQRNRNCNLKAEVSYSDFLPAAFTLAHRALAAAAILALPAALILRFFLGAGFAADFPFAFAHLAL